MTEHRHAKDGHVAAYRVTEPSLPETHDSIELTEDAVVTYEWDDSEQWIWTDEVVQCTARR
jgi:hypothetical protein